MMKATNRLKLVPAQPPVPRAAPERRVQEYFVWFVLLITGAVAGYSFASWL